MHVYYIIEKWVPLPPRGCSRVCVCGLLAVPSDHVNHVSLSDCLLSLFFGRSACGVPLQLFGVPISLLHLQD